MGGATRADVKSAPQPLAAKYADIGVGRRVYRYVLCMRRREGDRTPSPPTAFVRRGLSAAWAHLEQSRSHARTSSDATPCPYGMVFVTSGGFRMRPDAHYREKAPALRVSGGCAVREQKSA